MDAQASRPVVLVPVTNGRQAQISAGLAGLLARERGAEIVLAYIVRVPLAYPLEAPTGAMARSAEAALGAARESIEAQGLPVRTAIYPARGLASGLTTALAGVTRRPWSSARTGRRTRTGSW